MARSTYVYVVFTVSDYDKPGEPVAAFTVKRECKQWLGGRDREPMLPDLRLFRMDDGHGGVKAEMDIDELLNS